ALANLPGSLRDFLSFMDYTARRFYNDNCAQTAAALTYTVLLAFVPLMTISFAIFRAFPAYETLQKRAQSLLFNTLVPAVGETLGENINRFTANAGQLTAFGIVGLAVTSVLLFNTIESSFSGIWRVREPRPIVTRLLAFWTILTLAPLLFGASLSLSSYLFALLRIEGDQPLPLGPITYGVPGLIELIGFTLVYTMIPNRAVRWQDAAIGGVVAAVALEVSKFGFGLYIATFPVYQTIYGALSTIPIFLLWLYIAWCTVLGGAEMAASLPEWRAGKISQVGPDGLLPAQRVTVALAVLHELHCAARLGVGMRRHTLIGRVPIGAALLDGMLETLTEAHWVARTSKSAWVCTRDLGEATLYDLLKALSVGLRGPIRIVAAIEAPWLDRCAALLETADATNRELLGIPISELLRNPADAAPARRPEPAAQRRGIGTA
ncbi:MAG TPA: YihY family inner membrane protein, partial [Acetobacteraceae bacterium]